MNYICQVLLRAEELNEEEKQEWVRSGEEGKITQAVRMKDDTYWSVGWL